ncbi:MAG: hypothetical protein COA74_11115 [Gammaproteobacteria bacterium]|nr:MAG: hypothetical protein COA74_11115 [Gammaproteobacteria bacterium]
MSKLNYKKLLSSNKITENVEDIVADTIYLNVSEQNSAWNKAAVILVGEQNMTPDKNLTLVCYPQIERRMVSTNFTAKTTNEWNKLALKSVEKST